MLIKIIHKISYLTSWLFPKRCFGCCGPDELFCKKCLSALPPPSISRVGYISAVFSASEYDDPALKLAIRALKYRSGRKIADILAGFLANELHSNMSIVLKEKPLVLAIPMSRGRKRERGYNHAELLAEIVAQKLSLPFKPEVLKKIKDVFPQAECRSRRERLENIRDSIGVNPDFDFHGKNILLIDDVSTTGATLNEAARVLKKAGAAKIYAAVVARG